MQECEAAKAFVQHHRAADRAGRIDRQRFRANAERQGAAGHGRAGFRRERDARPGRQHQVHAARF